MTAPPKLSINWINILPWISTASLAVILALGDGRYAKEIDQRQLVTKVEVMDQALAQISLRVAANEAIIQGAAKEYIPRRELESMFQNIREALSAQVLWNERYDKKLDLIAERLVHEY